MLRLCDFMVLSTRIFRLQWVGTSHWFSYEYLIDSVTNISLIQLWMGICIAGQNAEYSNLSVYKWSVYELMVIPESQINTYFSICWPVLLVGLFWTNQCLYLVPLCGCPRFVRKPQCLCRVCPEVVWLRYNFITVIYHQSFFVLLSYVSALY